MHRERAQQRAERAGPFSATTLGSTQAERRARGAIRASRSRGAARTPARRRSASSTVMPPRWLIASAAAARRGRRGSVSRSVIAAAAPIAAAIAARARGSRQRSHTRNPRNADERDDLQHEDEEHHNRAQRLRGELRDEAWLHDLTERGARGGQSRHEQGHEACQLGRRARIGQDVPPFLKRGGEIAQQRGEVAAGVALQQNRCDERVQRRRARTIAGAPDATARARRRSRARTTARAAHGAVAASASPAHAPATSQPAASSDSVPSATSRRRSGARRLAP